MDSSNRQAQARRLPGQVGRRGKNTSSSILLPEFTFEPQTLQEIRPSRTLWVPDSATSEEEALLSHEGRPLSPCLPTQFDAKRTRYPSDFDSVGNSNDHLSALGESSSLFSDISPATEAIKVTKH